MGREQTTSTDVHLHEASPSFGRYEAARILVPGFYIAFLLFLFYVSFLSRFVLLPFSAAGFFLLLLAVSLVAGLTAYAKEVPKRRRAFLENQPSQYLSSKARAMKDMPLLDQDEAKRLYFYILSNHVPPAFHEKIFFFGTIYHIMIQIRRTSFWFGVLTAATAAYQISSGIPLPDQQGLLVLACGVWLVYLLNIRYNKADRKMQENYQDQIFWMQMNNDLIENILRKRRSISPQ